MKKRTLFQGIGHIMGFVVAFSYFSITGFAADIIPEDTVIEEESTHISLNDVVEPLSDDPDVVSSFSIDDNILTFDTEKGPEFKIDIDSWSLISCSTKVGSAKILAISASNYMYKITVASGDYPGAHTYKFDLLEGTAEEIENEYNFAVDYLIDISLKEENSNGKYFEFSVEQSPQNVPGVTYEWASSNPTVLEYVADSFGSFKYISDGETVITVTATDSFYNVRTASVPLSVKNPNHHYEEYEDPSDKSGDWFVRYEEDSSGSPIMVLCRYTGTSKSLTIPSTATANGKNYKVVLEGTGEGYYDPEAGSEAEKWDSGANGTFPIDTTSIVISEGVVITNPQSLFCGLKNLKTVSIGGWTSEDRDEKSFDRMFAGCSSLKSVDLSKCHMTFSDLRFMFAGCESLENINLSGLSSRIDDDITQRGHYSLSDFDGFLYGSDNVKEIVLVNGGYLIDQDGLQYQFSREYADSEGNWIQLWGDNYALSGGWTLYRIQENDGWRFVTPGRGRNNAVLMDTDYEGASLVIPAQITLSGIKYNTVISNALFIPDNVSEIRFENGVKTTVNLSYIFSGKANLKKIDFNGLDSSLANNFDHMFEDCTSLESVDLSPLDTSRIVSLDETFKNCINLTDLNLSNIYLYGAMNTNNMLEGCQKLKSFKTPRKAQGKSIDLPVTLYDASGRKYTSLSSEMELVSSIRLTDGSVPIDNIDVAGVKMSDTYVKLKIGESRLLYAYVSPADATNQTVTWMSSRPEVAEVDKFGRITAIAAGSSKITATTENGNKTATCTVIVSSSDPGGNGSGRDPRLNTDEGTIESGVKYYDAYMVKGQTYVFPATYGDIDQSEGAGAIAWKTSDKQKASVSGKTKVKAVNATDAKAPVQIYDGATFSSSKYVYRVNIVSPVLAEYGNSSAIKSKTLTAGDTYILSMTGLDGFADKYSVTWLSSNNEIATVNDGIVNALSKGSAKITAYVGGIAYSCNIKVVDTQTVPKKIEDGASITLSPLQSATVKFNSVFFKAKNLEWTSSDDEMKAYNKNGSVAGSTDKISYFQNGVVRVTPTGKVTAIGEGTTTITATDGNNMKQTVSVTVTTPVSRSVYLNANKTKAIKFYNVPPAKATWKSDAEDTTGNMTGGKIKGIKQGVATVTCTYDPYGTGNPFVFTTIVSVENPKLNTSGSAKLSGVNPAKTSATLEMKVGDSFPIEVEGVYQDPVFTSAKPAIAFVDENGVISARSAGKTKVSAKINGTTLTVNLVVTK